MSSYPTPSKAMAIAQHERALTGLAIADSSARGTWASQHVISLAALAKLIDRIALSKALPCKITRGSSPTVKLSNQGRTLIDLLTQLAPWIDSVPNTLKFDPRLQALVDIARPCRLKQYGMQTTPQWARIQTFDGLNGLVQELRAITGTRRFYRDLLIHESRLATRLKRLRKYFTEVARQAPESAVLRLELRVAHGASQAWRTFESESESFGRWFSKLIETHGTAIAGNAWKFDLDPFDGYILHVTVIVRDSSSDHPRDVFRSACHLWQAIAGDAGFLLDCNAPYAGLQYRGWNTDEWGSAIREELDRAATYLTSTDGLFRLDFGPDWPSAGFESQFPRMSPF